MVMRCIQEVLFPPKLYNLITLSSKVGFFFWVFFFFLWCMCVFNSSEISSLHTIG